MFRKIQPTRQASKKGSSFTDTTLIAIVKSEKLLNTPKRQKYLESIRKLTRLSDEAYASVYTATIEHFVEYVQRLPMPNHPEFDQHGGVLELALERASLSLYEYTEYLKSHGFYPITFSVQQELWNYILFNAALLRDLAFVASHYKIQIFNSKREYVKQWSPAIDDFSKLEGFYKVTEEETFSPAARKPLLTMLAKRLTPQVGWDWICDQFESFQTWLDLLLTDDDASGGRIGLMSNLILWANQFLVTPGTGTGGPPTFEQRLVMLLSKPKTEGGKPAPKARELPSGAKAPPPPHLQGLASVGVNFIVWLQTALQSGLVNYNHIGAPIQRVPEGVFLNSTIFELFFKLNKAAPAGIDATMLKQQLLEHGLASGTTNGTFEASYQANKQLETGVIIQNVDTIFPNQSTDMSENYKAAVAVGICNAVNNNFIQQAAPPAKSSISPPTPLPPKS